MEKYTESIDVIQLNVGGDIITTTRETLMRVPKSLLSTMFNGRWEQKLQTDPNENIFFDFNPVLFRHLLSQLQLIDPTSAIDFHLPVDSSLALPFKRMLRKLGFDQFLSSQKNTISLNVGGQMMTNQRVTFDRISNTTLEKILSSSNTTHFGDRSDAFLDYDPRLFRQLVNEMWENPDGNMCCLEVSSSDERYPFQKMLDDLSVCRK